MLELLLEKIVDAFSLFIGDMIDIKKHKWVDFCAWILIIFAIILAVYCLIKY